MALELVAAWSTLCTERGRLLKREFLGEQERISEQGQAGRLLGRMVERRIEADNSGRKGRCDCCGTEYTPHYDWTPDGNAHSRWLSGLIYLNTPSQGGATSFPKARMGKGQVQMHALSIQR